MKFIQKCVKIITCSINWIKLSENKGDLFDIYDTDLTNLIPEGETSLTSPLLSIKAKTPFLSPTPTRHWSLLLSLDDNSFGILMQNFTLKITSLLNNQKGVP